MRLIGVVIALVLAFGAFYVALKVLGGSDEPAQTTASNNVLVTTNAPDVQTVDVLVAARPIPIGEKIAADMVTAQPWPSHLVLGGFVTSGDTSKQIIGMVSRSSFQKDEPIILNKLANPSDPGFIAAALPAGKKMVTIATDGVAGLAGFVFPGDRVDVLVTHPIPKEDIDEEEADKKENQETVTETVLSDVKVLAVDQRAEAGTTEEKIPLPSSISLEVALADAQKLRLAQETGYLSLALRSLEDKDATQTTDVTHVRDLTQSDAYKKLSGKDGNVTVVRGTTSTIIKITKSKEEKALEDTEALEPVDETEKN